MDCPKSHCVCRTLQQKSQEIWADLSDADLLKSQVHEDSITQYLSLNLNRTHADRIRAHNFSKTTEEPKNGSDFLWLILSPDGSIHTRLAIQAKRLYESGGYNAFKPNQVDKISAYAKIISGHALYLTYNYRKLGPGAWSPLYKQTTTNFVYLPRDAGLLFVDVDDIRSQGTPYKFTKDLVLGRGIPAWRIFCDCDELRTGKSRSKFEQIAAALNGDRIDVSADLRIHKTSERMKAWFDGSEAAAESLKEELGQPFADGDPDTFTPSFVIATLLAPPHRVHRDD